MPVGLTADCTLKSALLLLVAMNVRTCGDSLAGPALMAVAHGFTVCAPQSSRTVWSAPLVKDGMSLTGVTVRCTVPVAYRASRTPCVVPSSRMVYPNDAG